MVAVKLCFEEQVQCDRKKIRTPYMETEEMVLHVIAMVCYLQVLNSRSSPSFTVMFLMFVFVSILFGARLFVNLL